MHWTNLCLLKSYIPNDAAGALPMKSVTFTRELLPGPVVFESSNNLFSNYVLYKIGRECSNGAPLSVLADRKLNNRPFCNFLGDPKKEDTEIHMRIYWQLWLYFHRCGIKSDFYRIIQEIA